MEMVIIEKSVLDELYHRIEEMNNRLKKLYIVSGGRDKYTWMDSQEVCRLYGISKRSLQNYRERGMIAFTQIGAKIYYKSVDMEAFFMSGYVPLPKK